MHIRSRCEQGWHRLVPFREPSDPANYDAVTIATYLIYFNIIMYVGFIVYCLYHVGVVFVWAIYVIGSF